MNVVQATLIIVVVCTVTVSAMLLVRRRTPEGSFFSDGDTAEEASSVEVRRDIQRASRYVLGVVLYAVVLFFAGMSAKLSNPRLQAWLLSFGYAVFILAVAWVATFPVSLQI